MIDRPSGEARFEDTLVAAADFLRNDLLDSADERRLNGDDDHAGYLEALASTVTGIDLKTLALYAAARSRETAFCSATGQPDRIHCSMTMELGDSITAADAAEVACIYASAVAIALTDPRWRASDADYREFWQEFRSLAAGRRDH